MVNDLINHILPSIEHFHFGGYWLAFFAAFLETTLGIGLLLPGSTIILVLGALSARGYVDTGDLVWFAVLGAILGDNINYYLGRRYGARWLEKGFWFLRSNHIEKARHFMDAHGAKSVFLGRFIPSVKEVVPFIAGSVKMNKRTFMLWNVLGAIGWGFQWVLAGYIFAQSLNLAEVWLSRAGLFFTLLVVLGVILYFFKLLIIKKGKEFLAVSVSLWQSIKEAVINNEHVSLWTQKHPRSVSFLQARLNPKAFSGLTLSILTVAFVYVLALFGGVVEDLITSDPIVAADVRIANLFSVFRTDALTKVFTWITLLGKSQVILAFIAVLVALLWLWRKSYYIIPLFIAVTGSEGFTYLGKLAFHRPRPELAVYAEHSFSFPSGHATIAVAFYGFAGYFLARFAQSWNRKVNISFITILLIIAIGFSRVYLGEHYISDVWGGYLVGAMWLIIAISVAEWLGYQKISDKYISPVRRARSISFALVFIAILFYVGFSLRYHPALASVPSNKPMVVSKSTDIFASEQMKYTETLIGERQEPVNFIFLAKDDGQLESTLQQAGWVLTDRADISSFIKAIKALIMKVPYPSAPISPSFWNTKIQDLSFAKVTGTNWLRNAQHLKIWRTNYLLDNGQNIYVGMANANAGFEWGIIPKIAPNLDAEREQLFQDLNHTGKILSHLKVQVVKSLIGKNFMGNQFFTDGKAYIVTVQ
ncbi:MAG: LssY C-terminal domain-containing protein [Deltaproteobacteria bacterium]|jgi:membrane protein DedA with SNARE-associated domain/membrane-associated phospholipid phosphatase